MLRVLSHLDLTVPLVILALLIDAWLVIGSSGALP